ncbi:hypothetical protein Tsubulata_027358 [Turnera subulata]|uniref:LOB domain-containing protein n=1 Tax=Turnera subulata TaxID=218843 RepID=A0A9Q0J5J1_9ROSI|nr:hypothetical protein Tsubulata_027358 [Turnera subulata]
MLLVLVMMTIKGGAHQACAVCKYQRRRCTKECPLAPYFPADQQKVFQNAHRLFGVKNITNILRQVPDTLKEEAMRSIKYQSDMRARFPVHGCLGIVCQLQMQLQQTIEEFRYVNAQLAMYRDHQNPALETTTFANISPPPPQQQQQQLSFPISCNSTDNDSLGLYQYHHQNPGGGGGGGGNNSGAMTLALNDFLGSGNSNNGCSGGVYGGGGGDHHHTTVATTTNRGDVMVKPLNLPNNYCGNMMNMSDMRSTQSQLFVPQGCPIQQEIQVSYDYDDIPFEAAADDSQSYIESKDAWKSSAESSWKNSVHSPGCFPDNNELKNVATRLSLTSIE